MRSKIYLALLLVLAPVAASARPRMTGGGMRPQLFRDRTPKARIHTQIIKAPR
ncbi:MAG TPA: hypothetical protein VK608_00740 [Edaphobacter sp.]|nr:hypothetical protein [Edaphobacter sp.]